MDTKKLATTSSNTKRIEAAFLHQLRFALGRDRFSEDRHYHYVALVQTIREQLMPQCIATHQAYYENNARRSLPVARISHGSRHWQCAAQLDLDMTVVKPCSSKIST